MLPEPKNVARVIKRVFRTAKQKRQDAEYNRDVQIRMGKAKLQRHIQNQKKMAIRLKGLAKRALAIDDDARFRQVGRQLLWTKIDVRRWEQYSLSLELLQARRDQAKASVTLIETIKATSESLVAMAGPQNVAELQRELETGLAQASNLDERMTIMMEMMDTTLASDMVVEEDRLDNLESSLTEEVIQDEASDFEDEIEAGLRKIRKELQDEIL
jgi:hypothetical protein